jgi:hypothetical protein
MTISCSRNWTCRIALMKTWTGREVCPWIVWSSILLSEEELIGTGFARRAPNTKDIFSGYARYCWRGELMERRAELWAGMVMKSSRPICTEGMFV